MQTKNYLLTDSLIGSVSIYMILKRLMSDFKDWDAYKLGIIDAEGNKLKTPVTSKQRESWDILTRFCWNLKKVTTKFIGKSKFASYFTAAYLLKDSFNAFYIKHNQAALNETLLEDITFAKQLALHNAMKDLPVTEKITEENIEFYLFKYFKEFAVKLHEHQEIFELFGITEEGEGAPAGDGGTGFSGTVAADIAQHGQRIGGVKTRKTKKKRKKRGKSTFTVDRLGNKLK